MLISEVQLYKLGPVYGNATEFDVLNLAYKSIIETPRFMNAFREICRRVRPRTISVPEEHGPVFCANMAFKRKLKRMNKSLHYSDGKSRRCVVFSSGAKSHKLCKSCYQDDTISMQQLAALKQKKGISP